MLYEIPRRKQNKYDTHVDFRLFKIGKPSYSTNNYRRTIALLVLLQMEQRDIVE